MTADEQRRYRAALQAAVATSGPGLIPEKSRWDRFKEAFKEALTEDVPRYAKSAVAGINDSASFGAIPAIQERLPSWAGGVPGGTYENAMAAAPLAAIAAGYAAPNPLGKVGQVAKTATKGAKNLAAKLLRKEKYPLLDPGVAETMAAVEAERLGINETLGMRGDDYGPVERFRKSRDHTRDDRLTASGSYHAPGLPGVSALEIARDTASGPEVDPRTWDRAFQFERRLAPPDALRPVEYGDRVFLLKGNKADPRGLFPTDVGEGLIADHRILGELKVPGRSYPETEADKAVNDSINEYLRRRDAERAAELAAKEKLGQVVTPELVEKLRTKAGIKEP